MGGTQAISNDRAEEAAPDADFAHIAHWANYGQSGQYTSRPAEPNRPTEGRPAPFSMPQIVEWHRSLTRQQLDSLSWGFVAREMEDKWNVYVSEARPSNESASAEVVTMHFCRSWTGFQLVQADIEIQLSSARDEVEDISIVKLIYETDESKVRGNDEAQAKEYVLTVCQWVMGVRI